MKRVLVVFLSAVLVCGFAPAAFADEEDGMIVMSHLGGTLAVSLEAVETVFFMEKDGKARFHLVWSGNADGKTLEGAEAAEVWSKVQKEMKSEFLWVGHMGGSLGIQRDAVTSVFFMPAKDGKAATLRINYGSEAKTVEGGEAEAVWGALSK